MKNVVIEKKEDGTVVLTIALAHEIVEKARQDEIEKIISSASIEGFRKGKAPRKIVESRIDTEKLKEDVLRKLIPTAYTNALEETKLKPIVSPKIHVEKIEDGKDWEFKATTCEMPTVDISGYKDAIGKLTAKSKIIIPGQETQEPKVETLLETLITHTKTTIPQMLIDAEVERLLAQLLDEVKRLGLSLDQYLSSTSKTIETIKQEYLQRAQKELTLEFALQKVAEVEHISVEPEEISEALQKAKDDSERKQLEANVYLLASILRQQKTIDFIKKI